MKPNNDKYFIVYDFTEVDYEGKNIRFENILSGTFNICGQVFDASKIMTYRYSDKKSTLTIEIDTKKLDFRVKKMVEFSYYINVDDSSCSSLLYNATRIIETNSCVKTSIPSIDDSTITYNVSYTLIP